ncbi:hypothetical protein OIU79_020088 [Salix purpurea]|uniref:Uncharacterized protein n=1 Tax=Salix purpurea TaxID=77065 RepID=A0A9Q0P2Q0_SALPP|nr:hypothetical protein OIU79_020088 [Salix purpurea]
MINSSLRFRFTRGIFSKSLYTIVCCFAVEYSQDNIFPLPVHPVAVAAPSCVENDTSTHLFFEEPLKTLDLYFMLSPHFAYK